MGLRFGNISVFLQLNEQSEWHLKINIYQDTITTIHVYIYHRLLLVRTLPTTTTTVDDRNENKACCAGAGLTLAGVFWAVVTYTAATQIIKPTKTVDCRNSPVRWRHPYHWSPVPCAGCWSVPGPAQGRHQCLEARCLELHIPTDTQHMQQFYLHTTPPDQGYRGQYHTLCVIDIDMMHEFSYNWTIQCLWCVDR